MNKPIDPEKMLLQIKTDLGRQPKREDLRRLINSLSVRLGAPLVVLLGLVSVFVVKLDPMERPAIWWFIVAMTAVIVLAIEGSFILAEFRVLSGKIQQHLETSATNAKDEMIKILKEILDPRVVVLGSLSEVRAEAAKLMMGAIQNAKEVWYFGAANLTPSQQELREAGHSDKGEPSDVVTYQNVLNDLKNSAAKIIRYIWLFDDDRFELRDPITRDLYLAWLNQQLAHLRVNPNYVIYNSRRAPEWGGPRSSILTSSGQLDIVGDGGVGLLVLSVVVPDIFFRKSKEYLWHARRVENKPQQYTADNANKLQAIFERQTKLHRKLLAAEKKLGKRRKDSKESA